MRSDRAPVQGPAHYRELVGQAKADFGSLATNSFLLPDVVAAKCQSGNLLFQRLPHALFFFEDMGRYYRFYYYKEQNAAAVPQSAMAKPLMAEEPTRKKAGAAAQDAWYTGLGFRPTFTTLRMQMPARAGTGAPAPNSFVVQTAGDAHLPALMDLWLNEPLLVDILIPDEAGVAREISAGEILIAVDSAGAVLGAIRAVLAGKTGESSRLAVHPSHRGRGIGPALMRGYMDTVEARGAARHVLWVIDTSTGAQRLHEKLGYRFDGIVSRQYLLGAAPGSKQ